MPCSGAAAVCAAHHTLSSGTEKDTLGSRCSSPCGIMGALLRMGSAVAWGWDDEERILNPKLGVKRRAMVW